MPGSSPAWAPDDDGLVYHSGVAGEPAIGDTVAHFSLLRELGRGGMGVVYEARDAKLARRVALKLLPAAVATDADRRGRFLREARVAAAVHHPAIATVFEVGESEGRLYIAMELVEGQTLRSALGGGRLPAARALRIARDVCAGLAKAHRNGVAHRDLKPENIMLATEGGTRLLDFGIAKALSPEGAPGVADAVTETGQIFTGTGQILGTPGYMAPEQATGERADQRVDVFAMGVVLFEMLTGRVPFAGNTPLERLASVLRDEAPGLQAAVPELAVGVGIDSVIGRCLAKKPEARFRDAGELLAALEELGASEPGERSTPAVAPDPGTVNPYAATVGGTASALVSDPDPGSPTASRRRRTRTWLVAGVVVALAGAGAGVAWITRHATAPAGSGALARMRAEAHDARERALQMRPPRYQGDGSAADVQSFVKNDIAAWVKRKKSAVDAASRALGHVYELTSAPAERVDVQGQAAALWADFVDDFRNTPVPNAIRDDLDTRYKYESALYAASAPMIRTALDLARQCDQLATEEHVSTDAAHRCSDLVRRLAALHAPEVPPPPLPRHACPTSVAASDCDKGNVPWCDDSDKVIACCGPGLMAAGHDGMCGCAPGGTEVKSAVDSGCARAKPDDHHAFQAAIKLATKRIDHCYDAALKRTGKLSGRMAVRFDLTPEGKVIGVRLRKVTLPDMHAQKCALDALQQVQFPPPRAEASGPIGIEFSFGPGDRGAR